MITLLTVCTSVNTLSTSGGPGYSAELMSMIQNGFQNNRTQIGRANTQYSSNNTPCQFDKEEEPCPPSKYRTDSGICYQSSKYFLLSIFSFY